MASSPLNRKTAQLEPLSLRTNFQWTFVGNVVFAAAQWMILIAIARLGSPALVGKFALGLAISAPIFMFTNMNLRAVLATDRASDHPFSVYLGVRLITVPVSMLAVYVAVVGFSFDRSAVDVVLLVALSKGIEAVGDIFHGLFQKHERMDLMSVSKAVRGISGALSLAAAMFWTGSLLWGLAALIACWLAVLVLFDIPFSRLIAHRREPRNDGTVRDGPITEKRAVRTWWQPHRSLVWLALPLGLTASVASINENIPRYVVQGFLGVEELGVFASSAYLMRLLGVFGTAVSAAALPRLAQIYADRQAERFVALIKRLASIAAGIGIGAVAVAALVGDSILVIVYGPEYREQAVFVAVMAAASAAVMMAFLSQALIAARRFKASLVAHVAAAAATLIASLALIPPLGLVGAGAAMAIGLAVGVLSTWWILRKVVVELNESVRAPDGRPPPQAG